MSADPRTDWGVFARLVNFESMGQGILMHGHSLAVDVVDRELALAFGPLPPDSEARQIEMHLSEQRRVMWCGRHGDPCDMEGEWHTHWHPVKPSSTPATHYTFAYYEKRSGGGS